MRGTGKTKSREKIENQSYAVGSPDYPTVSGLVLSLYDSLPPASPFAPSISRFISVVLSFGFSLALLFSTSTARDPRRYNHHHHQHHRENAAAAAVATTSFSSSSSSSTFTSSSSYSFRFCGPLGPRSSLIQSNESRSSIRHTRRRISLYSVCFSLSITISISIFISLPSDPSLPLLILPLAAEEQIAVDFRKSDVECFSSATWRDAAPRR